MITDEATLVVLEVPLAEKDAGPRMHHVDLHLETPHAIVLRRLRVRLEREGATIGGVESDRKVASTQDAVRWLLERIMEQPQTASAAEGGEGDQDEGVADGGKAA